MLNGKIFICWKKTDILDPILFLRFASIMNHIDVFRSKRGMCYYAKKYSDFHLNDGESEALVSSTAFLSLFYACNCHSEKIKLFVITKENVILTIGSIR